MNLKYSGDTRDLFKFDLVRQLIKGIPEFRSFTFVPMITDEERRTKQKKSAKLDLGAAARKGLAGTKNRDLMECMGRLQEINDDLSYFSGVHSYFRQENIMVDVLHKDRFSHENRVNYFQKLFDSFPKESLILLDPDIGLEVKNPTQRHLLFDEVNDIFSRMDTSSVLMIYQHIPRVIRKGYITKRCDELAGVCGSRPETITDNEIVFFLLPKNNEMRTKVCNVLAEYSKHYNVLTACVAV
jgi:hypothetical protein